MPSTYSYSALRTFRGCPRKFKFQYVDKVDIPKKVTADTYLGNVVHRVLAKLYRLGSDGIVYPLDDMIALYRGYWEKVERGYITLTDDYHAVDDYIRRGEEMLVKHYERYQPFDQGTLLGTELHLRLTLSDTPFKFTTIIDKLWKRDDGVIEICDYKTGQRLVRPQDEDFFFQMGLYQLAVQENYPQFETIELAQYLLRLDEEVHHRMHPDELDRLTEEIRSAVIETIQAERLDDFPPKESHLCTYCDYFYFCPAKRHRLMLEQQEELEELSPQQQAYDLATRFLETYQRSLETKAELETLRTELIRLSRDQGLTTLRGKSGQVTVKTARQEKFVTKTMDAELFADLSHLARELQLDDYFDLNTRALMKEVYQKKRLPPNQLEKLRAYVHEIEESRVTSKFDREKDTPED
jgi:RecB family exonuclease